MSDSEEEFTPEKAQSKSKPKSIKEDKPKKGKKSKEKVKEGKGKAEKVEKVLKKKKISKQKQDTNTSEVTQLVFEYMQKQNRPYNLLNVFDNLHGKIKKPVLEAALNELVDEGRLTAKQFSKNKVYYLNQEAIDVNKETVERLAHQHSQLRKQELELGEQYRQLMDECKRLMSKKTINEIKYEIQKGQKTVQTLLAKKNRLMSEGAEKVDEKQVEKVQKDEQYLQKQLKKRKKLTKQCIGVFCEMMQMKKHEVADMMGLEI